MKKKRLALVGIVVLVLSLISSPALADSRLGIGSSSSVVVHGTTATFTPHLSGVGESGNYDWARLKWDISPTVGQALVGTLSVWQLNTGTCQGTTSGPSGSYRTCNTALSGNRIVANAATTYANGASATAKINAVSGEATLRIRLWLDRNNNNQIDAYEPSSKVQLLQVLNPQNAKPFINFRMDPPIIGESTLRATVAAGSVIAPNHSTSGIIDPSKLSIRLTQCKLNTCTQISGSTTWLDHPQLQEYEFVAQAPFDPASGFGAELIYAESPTETYVIGADSFDYRSAAPVALETTITAPQGLLSTSSTDLPHKAPRQNTFLAGDSLTAFVYTARARDEQGNALVNQEVFVVFDLKDFAAPTSIVVNGMQLTSGAKDRVLLKRRTNSQGIVQLNISTPTHGWLDRIGIDLLVNGYRSWELPGDGAEQVLTWDGDGQRRIELVFSKESNLGSSDRFVTVKARVTDGSGRAINGEKILFGGHPDLIIKEPVQTLYNGYAQVDVGLSNLVDESGTSFVTALIIGEGGSIQVSQKLSWEAYGETLLGEQKLNPLSKSSVAPLGASIKKLGGGVAELRVPGTSQALGVKFSLNGRGLAPQVEGGQLVRRVKLVPGMNLFKIYVNGLLATEASIRK